MCFKLSVAYNIFFAILKTYQIISFLVLYSRFLVKPTMTYWLRILHPTLYIYMGLVSLIT